MYPKIPIQVIESDRVMLDAIVIAWEHHFLFVHFSSFFSTYIDNLMRIYFIITRRGPAVVGFTVTASIASTCDGLQQATSAIYGLFYSKHFGGFRSIQLGLFETWHLIKIWIWEHATMEEYGHDVMLLWGFRQWSRHKMPWLQQWCLSLWAVEFWATPTRCSVARCVFLKIAGRLNLFAAKYPTIHDSMCLYSGKVLMTTNDHSHVLLSLWSLKIWKICERWRDSGPKISWMVVSKKWWCLARDIGVCRGFLWKKLANRGDAVYYLVTCCFITRGGDAILQLNNNDKLIQIGYIWSAWNTFLQVLQDFICPTLVSDLLFSPSFSVKSSASHRKIRLDRNVTHRRSLSKRIW